MSKYYEGEAIVKEFTETTNQSATWARGILARMKEADVAPVVHGHWIKHEWAEEVEGMLIPNYECSHCHMWLRDDRQWCGECGAKMDEEVSER